MEPGTLIAEATKTFIEDQRTAAVDPFDKLEAGDLGIRLQWPHREHSMPDRIAFVQIQPPVDGEIVSTRELEIIYPLRIFYMVRVMEDDVGTASAVLMKFEDLTREEIMKRNTSYFYSIVFPATTHIFLPPVIVQSGLPAEVTDQPSHHGIEMTINVSTCRVRG